MIICSFSKVIFEKMLPKDVAALILRKLNVFGLCNCLKTSKYFQVVIKEKNIWEFFYNKDFIHYAELWRGNCQETYKFRFLFKRLSNLKGYSEVTLFTKSHLYFTSSSGNEMLKVLPKEINLLENLHVLSVNGNELTEISKELCTLINLKKIIFAGNLITEIPKEIGKLTNLELLNLGENQITHIPPEISLLTKLEALLLFKNRIKKLPKEIAKLTNLTALNFDNNKITEIAEELYDLIGFAIFIKDRP